MPQFKDNNCVTLTLFVFLAFTASLWYFMLYTLRSSFTRIPLSISLSSVDSVSMFEPGKMRNVNKRGFLTDNV